MKNTSNLLLITNQNSSCNSVVNVLQHYFPTKQHSQNQHLLITTKYYNAEVQIHQLNWSQSHQNKDEIKYQCILMITSEEQQFPIKLISSVIEQYQPQSYAILVNTIDPDTQWHYQNILVQQCEKFIEVIKQNFNLIEKQKPLWEKKGFLSTDKIQPIYDLLDMLTTIQWRSMKKNILSKVSVKLQLEEQSQKKQELIKNQRKIQDQEQLNQIEKQKILQIKQNEGIKYQDSIEIKNNSEIPQFNDDNDSEENDENIQLQMNNFEAMMKQMMNIKSMQIHNQIDNNQRKIRAQNLMKKLTKNMHQ